MREPAETILEQYFRKHGYVRLRIAFQVRGVGIGYVALRKFSITTKLPNPAALWKAVLRIRHLVKGESQ